MKHRLLIMIMLICSMGLCLASESKKTTGGFWNNSATSSEEVPTGAGVQDIPPLPGDNPGGDNNNTPVGEGIFFLLALAGGYGLLRFKGSHYSKKQSSTDF